MTEQGDWVPVIAASPTARGERGPTGPIGPRGGPKGDRGYDADIWSGQVAPPSGSNYVLWVDTSADGGDPELGSSVVKGMGNLMLAGEARCTSGWSASNGWTDVVLAADGVTITNVGADGNAAVAGHATTVNVNAGDVITVFANSAESTGQPSITCVFRDGVGSTVSSSTTSSLEYGVGYVGVILMAVTVPVNAETVEILLRTEANNNGYTRFNRAGIWRGAGGVWTAPGAPVPNTGVRVYEDQGERIPSVWDAGTGQWKDIIAAAGVEVVDHGSLLGLGDDDHPQYLLVDGSRNLAGNLTVTGVLTVDSAIGIIAQQITLAQEADNPAEVPTKGYVDTEVAVANAAAATAQSTADTAQSVADAAVTLAGTKADQADLNPLTIDNTDKLVTPLSVNRSVTSDAPTDADTFSVGYLGARAFWTNEVGLPRAQQPDGKESEVVLKLVSGSGDFQTDILQAISPGSTVVFKVGRYGGATISPTSTSATGLNVNMPSGSGNAIHVTRGGSDVFRIGAVDKVNIYAGLTMQGTKIESVATPTASGDAANKSYVDAVKTELKALVAASTDFADFQSRVAAW